MNLNCLLPLYSRLLQPIQRCDDETIPLSSNSKSSSSVAVLCDSPPVPRRLLPSAVSTSSMAFARAQEQVCLIVINISHTSQMDCAYGASAFRCNAFGIISFLASSLSRHVRNGLRWRQVFASEPTNCIMSAQCNADTMRRLV